MITTKTQPASSFLWLCIGNQPQRLARIEYEFRFLSVGAPRRALLERLNALPHFLVPGRRWRGKWWGLKLTTRESGFLMPARLLVVAQPVVADAGDVLGPG